jgi:hypothetical protein
LDAEILLLFASEPKRKPIFSYWAPYECVNACFGSKAALAEHQEGHDSNEENDSKAAPDRNMPSLILATFDFLR